jgi:RHS repeat-associated protein
MVRPDVGNTAYAYDGAGRLDWEGRGSSVEDDITTCDTQVSDADKATYTVNSIGLTTFVNYNDSSPDRGYVHDANGRVTKITAGGVVTDLEYNSAGLLEKETMRVDGRNFILDYAYNSLGNLSGLTYPSGYVVSFAPNALGQPTKASAVRAGLPNATYVSNATYYPTGSINTFSYGNGLTHKTTLNATGLPTGIRDASADVVALDYGYTYDSNQNIKSLTDRVDNAFSLSSLVYDGLDRLKSVTGGSGIGNTTLAYDALGNITQYDNAMQHLEYHYNTKNQLTHVNKTDAPTVPNYRVFTYDEHNRGNVTGNGYRSFAFNRAGQLESSTKGARINTYVYDGNNRRVKQVDSKGTSYSMYSQDGTLYYRDTPDGGINYIYLGNRLVAKDGVILEEAGEQHYHAFGSSIEGEIDDAGYTGHKFDTDLGLTYMQARYYDPMIGRFYSNDPLDFRDVHSFNRYSYVNNNPYKYYDPTGLATEIRLRAVPLGPGYGHSFIEYRDTETRESRISRAGPYLGYPGTSSAVARDQSLGRAIFAEDTRTVDSVDFGDVRTIDISTVTVDTPFDEVRSQLESFNNEVNNVGFEYKPLTQNSNTYAGDAFSRVTGTEAINNSDISLPGLDRNLPKVVRVNGRLDSRELDKKDE